VSRSRRSARLSHRASNWKPFEPGLPLPKATSSAAMPLRIPQILILPQDIEIIKYCCG
jgi:hypothetical protein